MPSASPWADLMARLRAFAAEVESLMPAPTPQPSPGPLEGEAAAADHQDMTNAHATTTADLLAELGAAAQVIADVHDLPVDTVRAILIEWETHRPA